MALYEFSDVQLDVAFTKASSKAELTNLDNIATIVGKIAKWYDLYAWSAWTAPTVEVTGSGNAVTSASYGTGDNANKLTLTLGGTFLTQHPVIPVTTDTTSTDSPAFGSTFTAVDSVSRDANGHVTTLNTKTVTIPNTTMGAATSSAAGTIGLVPAPAAGEQASFLRGDGTWAIPTSTPYTAGTGLVLSGMTFNHSNSVTARTDYMQPYIKYDAQGHITGSSYWMATAKGADNTAGWVKVATIKHKMTYDNTPFLLDVSQRGNTISYRIHIRWDNANSVDPPLGEFLIASDHAWESIRPRAYIIKSATSTWDLYILKLDNYDAIAMILQPGLYFNDHTEWTWQNEHAAASAITGGTEATKKIYSTTDHTHDSLVSKALTASTLDGTAGNFFIKGTSLLGGINDWVGIQADAGDDKFQLIAYDNNLLFRQNDYGGTNTANWQAWNFLMTPRCVTGENGITTTIHESAIGSGDSATPFNLGVKIGHSNSVTAVTTTSLLKFAYDAQGHITGTAAVAAEDLPTKYAFVVDETSDFASYAWHKFAEVTIDTVTTDATATFLVSKTWGNTPLVTGILSAHIRTGGTKVFESAQFRWIITNGEGGINPNEFVMVYTNTASTSCKVELWHKQTSRYDGWVFKLLKEHSRAAYGACPWTLFKHNGHGSATYTTGTGEIVSTLNSIANPALSANKINTNAGDYQTPVYFSNGVPVVVNTAASGANFGIVPQVRNGDGVMEIGRYIDFHSTAAGTTDYDIRLDASSSSLLTLTSNSSGTSTTFRISGTLPQLRFTQTTSGSAYSDSNCGITAYPGGNPYGVNLVIQGGGNTIIGAGESPTALYTDIITTNKNPYGTTALTGGERMYITSDNEIYFVSGANGLSTTAFTDWTNLKTMIYDSSGYLKPSVNNKGSVGTSALKWASMYATTFYGLLNGTLALGTALSSSNNIDTDTKTTTGNWYSVSSSVSATIANTPVKGYGFHVFNIPTTNSNNTFQKQFLIGNTAIIPYMYRYLSNGSWSGGWRSPGTGFMYVIGTQTASTAAWTGVIPVPALYDGLTIAYYLPYASAASTNVTLNLTLSNGQTSGAINVYYTGTSRMTTHYGAGSTIILTYFSAGAIKVSGTATTDARWTHSDYNTNTNTAVTQSNSTTANYRALILGYNNSTTPSDLTATVTNTVYASENLYAQPSTGLIGCNGRKLITPFAIQTGSSKRQKITLQTLMTWLITTKKYIHSGIYEHVVLQTTWAYADNDILRLAVNGINYEMDLAGTRIEYIGSATSYNAGAFTLKIISPPTSSFTSTSGYTKFPPATIAVYTCNGSSYAPVWRMIMNGACGQPKIFESTDNLSVLPMPIEVTGLFVNWKVLLAQCTRLIYGGGDECSSFQVIIPLEYLKSLGTSGEMHIPLPFTSENNPIGRNYMILKYVNDNKFTIGYHNDGIDSIGGRGLWTMYGMY